MIHPRPIVVLWGQLVAFACATALLLCIMNVLAEVDGWVKFDSAGEIAREVGARLTLALAFGAAIGTVATLLTLPFVLRRGSVLQERCQWIAQQASLLVAIGFAAASIGILIRWGTQTGLLNITNRTSIVLWLGVSTALVFGCLLYSVVVRREVRAKTDFIETFAGPISRRVLLFGAFAGLLTAFSSPTEASRVSSRARKPRRRAELAGPNVVLVTFDALSAEDMSCYGYHLNTTPNIDALARNSCLFTNYYATSTFTTPNIVSMFSGRYPSNTRVYHYGGRLHGIETHRTFPHELQKAGYVTAASVANPGAHPGCLGFGDAFDELPAPPINDFATRAAAAEFRSAALAYDAGVAARFVPYMLEQMSPRTFGQRHTQAPPALSFQQALALLANAEPPYFLWVHTFAPHFPYLPDPPYLHKFLAGDELRTHADFTNMVDLKGYSYTPARQPIVDKARLRYNEWIAQADAAFGQFMAELATRGQMENTAMIVSADHGESFTGGYVGHGGATQRRPILHIPLLIHLPGQVGGQTIRNITDQTALAPTILELAGASRPDWMDGESLLTHLRPDVPSGTSLAFTQFLEPNSVFGAARHGTVGAIDGQYQYLHTLDDGSGALFALSEADRQSHDRTSEEPAVAARLRQHIEQRFPSLFGASL